MASMLRAQLAALTFWALACLCVSSPVNSTVEDVDLLKSEFRCEGKSLGAFYADQSTGCRMFHVCARGDRDQLLDLRFACLKGQAFDVQAKACDTAQNIVCNDSDVRAEEGFANANAIAPNGDTKWSDTGAIRVRRQLVPFFSSNNLPQTAFSCRSRKLGRFYADTEAGCQLFHVCALGESADELLDFQFLCLNGTVFDDTVQRCLPFAESDCNTRVQDISQSTTSTTPAPSIESNATNSAAAVVVAAALAPRREPNEAEATTASFLEDEYLDEEFTEEVPAGEEEFFEGEVVDEGGARTKRQAPFHSYDALPETSFSCAGKVPGGYYADVEAECQLYHVCAPGPANSLSSLQDFKFLCSNGTIFSQNTRACQAWHTVDCAAAPSFFRLNDDLSQFKEDEVPATTQHFVDDFAGVQVQEQQQQQQQQQPRPQRPRPQVQQQQEQPRVGQQTRRRQRPQVIREQSFPRDAFLDSQLALLEAEPAQQIRPVQDRRRPVEVVVQETLHEEPPSRPPPPPPPPPRRRIVRPLVVEESAPPAATNPPPILSTLREQEVRQQVHQMAQDPVVSIPEDEGFPTTSTFDETLKALVQTQREADARARALNRQQAVQEEVQAAAPARRRRIRPSQQQQQQQLNFEEPQPQSQQRAQVHQVQHLDTAINEDDFAPLRFEIQQQQPARRQQHQSPVVQRRERPRPQPDANFDHFASQVQAIFSHDPQQVTPVSQQHATRTVPTQTVAFIPSFSSLPSLPVSPASTLSVQQLPNLNDLPLFLPQPEQRRQPQQQQRSSHGNNGRQQLQFLLQPASASTAFHPTPVRFQAASSSRGRGGVDDGHVIVLHRGLVVEGSPGNGQLTRLAGSAPVGSSGFEFGDGSQSQIFRFRRDTPARMRMTRAVAVTADTPKTTFSCQGKVPGRFYADPETNCRTFHLCVTRLNSQSFACRNGTVFDQRSQACDDQTDSLNCVEDPQHYGIGEVFGSSVPILP